MIKVSANYFKAASLCVSKEETRYYLNGVFVEPCAAGGVTLTATDGHRLISIYDQDGDCTESAIVGLPKGALLKALPTGEVIVSDDGIFRHDTFISMKPVIIDGMFPDWRRVVVGTFGTRPTFPAINSFYMSDFGKIAGLVSGNLDNRMTRLIGGATDADPAWVSFPNCPNAFGIIMPMRGDAPQKKYPWFIAGPAQPKKVKKTEPKAEEKKAA
jgi:hypothetical protein